MRKNRALPSSLLRTAVTDHYDWQGTSTRRYEYRSTKRETAMECRIFNVPHLCGLCLPYFIVSFICSPNINESLKIYGIFKSLTLFGTVKTLRGTDSIKPCISHPPHLVVPSATFQQFYAYYLLILLPQTVVKFQCRFTSHEVIKPLTTFCTFVSYACTHK